MRSIYIVNPIINNKEYEEMALRESEAAALPDTKVHVVSIDKGPVSIECYYDEVFANPYVVNKVRELSDKADAVIINCFGDVAIDAAREVTSVPIIGPGASSMALAQLLGHKFSVVTVLSRLAPLIDKIARDLGTTKLASVRAVNMPVLELEDRAKTVEKLTSESEKAIKEDGAHIIVLGCTGMQGLAKQIQQELANRGYNIPVLDPTIVALKFAEILVDMKISQSRISYPPPPEKVRTGCD